MRRLIPDSLHTLTVAVFLGLCLSAAGPLQAGQVMMTPDGRWIELNADGTYRLLQQPPPATAYPQQPPGYSGYGPYQGYPYYGYPYAHAYPYGYVPPGYAPPGYGAPPPAAQPADAAEQQAGAPKRKFFSEWLGDEVRKRPSRASRGY